MTRNAATLAVASAAERYLVRCRLAVLAAVLCAGSSAFAQSSYPVKPVRLVVGFAPGGSTDVVARLLARRLSDSVGQAFVVENRAGAGSNIATQHVARSSPDGYTLLYGTSTAAVNVSLYASLPFNLMSDFTGISPVCGIPSILSVHPSLPVKSVKDLIALARSRPGEISYASAGSGSATHLATELFKATAGINLLHVPYKGAGPAMTDLLGGHVQVQFIFNATQVAAAVQGGRLRGLAVTSRRRLAALPDLPTMQEAGLKDFEAIVWNGLLAPAGTSADVVSRLNTLTAQAMKELASPLADMGAYPMYGAPEEFTAFLRTEIGKWAGVVKRAGVQVQ